MSRERDRGRFDERDFAHKGVSLLVRNLSYRTQASDLKRAFSKYGDVRDVYIPLHYHTNKRCGRLRQGGGHKVKEALQASRC
ncbi:unnamed protein product [Phaeothamnion confervicola]